jgi:hypothetical protein
MLTAKEVELLYETLLANKWIDQTVKIDLRLSRRVILGLSKLIEIGLADENRVADSLLQATLPEADVLRAIPAELREKAELTEMYEKMSALVAR